MARRQVISCPWQDEQGNPLALGRIVFEASGDALVTGTGELCAGIKGALTLDSSGQVAASPAQYMWPTDQMTPSNITYTVWVYSANGQLAWGPNYGLTVPSGVGSFNLCTWVPNQIGSGSGAAAGSLTLQVEGVNNVLQNLLNLESLDGSVTITDEGNGSVNFTAGGGLGATDWHKVGFTSLVAGSAVQDGVGLTAKAATNTSGGPGGIEQAAPFGSNQAGVYGGGAPTQGHTETFIYEAGTVSQGSFVTGTIQGGPINLSILKTWQVRAAVAPRYMSAWTANTRVALGTVVTDGAGNYFIQQTIQTTGQGTITGTTVPSWDTTVTHTTADNAGGGTAVWFCVGTHRPVLTQDFLLAITDCVDSGLSGGSNQVFSYFDPLRTNHTYNQIGFRYCPEPVAGNGNVGDQHIMAYAGGPDMTPVIVDTGVVPDNNGDQHTFGIKQLALGSFTFYIDGVLKATITVTGLTNPFWSVIYSSTLLGQTPGHLDPTSSFITTWFPNKAYGAGALMRQNTVFCALTSGTTQPVNDPVPFNPGVNDTVYTDNTTSWLPIGSNTDNITAGLTLTYIFWETSE